MLATPTTSPSVSTLYLRRTGRPFPVTSSGVKRNGSAWPSTSKPDPNPSQASASADCQSGRTSAPRLHRPCKRTSAPGPTPLHRRPIGRRISRPNCRIDNRSSRSTGHERRGVHVARGASNGGSLIGAALSTLRARPPFRFGRALGAAINHFVKVLFVRQALPRNAGHHDLTIWTSHEPDRLMDSLTALRLGQSLFGQLHHSSPYEVRTPSPAGRLGSGTSGGRGNTPVMWGPI